MVTGTDPDGDKVRYGVSWDNDNTVDQWTNLVPSGSQENIACNGRTGTVGVITEDEYGIQSGWISVISKSKPYCLLSFERLINRFSLMEKILNQ